MTSVGTPIRSCYGPCNIVAAWRWLAAVTAEHAAWGVSLPPVPEQHLLRFGTARFVFGRVGAPLRSHLHEVVARGQDRGYYE